ncbi:hypothetical protein SeLEV6574_g02288, partial [Synchytrium endobioticum]
MADPEPSVRPANPLPDKQRQVRSCDRCKIKKRKCSGRSPCDTCVKADAECTYLVPVRKRGPPPGAVVARRKNDVLSKGKSADEAAKHAGVSKARITTAAQALKKELSIEAITNQQPSTTNIYMLAVSELSQPVKTLPAWLYGDNASAAMVDSPPADVSGLFSEDFITVDSFASELLQNTQAEVGAGMASTDHQPEITMSRMQMNNLNQTAALSSQQTIIISAVSTARSILTSITQQKAHTKRSPIPKSLCVTSGFVAPDFSSLGLPPLAPSLYLALIKNFFIYFHPSLPLLDEPSFLHSILPTISAGASLSLVAVVCAIGAMYSRHLALVDGGKKWCAIFEELARSQERETVMIQPNIQSGDLSLCQTKILLSAFEASQQAVRLSLAMGYHLAQEAVADRLDPLRHGLPGALGVFDTSAPTVLQSQRQRVWWACLFVELHACIAAGLTSPIIRTDITPLRMWGASFLRNLSWPDTDIKTLMLSVLIHKVAADIDTVFSNQIIGMLPLLKERVVKVVGEEGKQAIEEIEAWVDASLEDDSSSPPPPVQV